MLSWNLWIAVEVEVVKWVLIRFQWGIRNSNIAVRGSLIQEKFRIKKWDYHKKLMVMCLLTMCSRYRGQETSHLNEIKCFILNLILFRI